MKIFFEPFKKSPKKTGRLISLSYLAGVTVLLVLAFVVLDRFVLPMMESRNMISGRLWKHENDLINVAGHEKRWFPDGFVEGEGDPLKNVWSSKGFPVEKKSAKKRILVIGDSFVWGDGYANMNHIWWRQLERELRSRGYADVEVVAAGHNGASTVDQIPIYERAAEVLAPDVVVWGLVSNDPDEKKFPIEVLPHTASSGIVTAGINLFPSLGTMLSSRHDAKRIAMIPEAEKSHYDYNAWVHRLYEEENFTIYRETLKKLAASQKKSGIPMLAVTLPNTARGGHDELLRKIPTELSALGIPAVDLYQPLADDAEKNLGPHVSALAWGVNPANGHPSLYVTGFYARKVADLLEERYSSLLGARSDDRKLQFKINDWIPARMPVTEPEDSVYSFDYPVDEAQMLQMPFRVPYVQLSLKDPVIVKSISLEGDGLSKGSLYVSYDDFETNKQSLHVFDLGSRTGSKISWELPPGKKLDSIRFNLLFAGDNRNVKLKVDTGVAQ